MSSGLKKAFDKLTHKDASHSHSGGTTPEQQQQQQQHSLPHVDSAVNSPPHSGTSTPVEKQQHPHHEKHHKSGLLHFGGGSSKAHDDHQQHDSGVKRSSSLGRTSTEGCHDTHEHFKAIKNALTGHKKGSHDGEATAAGPAAARPALAHHITEQDQRALKVDRQAELQQEQLARELAYKQAYERDPLNGKYGFLNIDATPNAIDTSGK